LWLLCPGTDRAVHKRAWMTFRIQALFCAVYEFRCCWPYNEGAFHFSYVCCLIPSMVMAMLAFCPGVRCRLQYKMGTLLKGHADVLGAASIACLIGSGRPHEVVCQARARFKGVRVDKLSLDVLANNAPDPAYNALAEPCALGDCDAFLSHSWHDDGAAKWSALQAWRAAFVASHGREPVVWLDKCCIDQNNIDQDLRCLPIFLKACKRLVVLSGPSYLSRLWCILELFTYAHMDGDIASVDVLLVTRPAEDGIGDAEAIAKSFDEFDAKECTCFCPQDKQRILAIIETAYGNMDGFNAVVKNIAYSLPNGPREARAHGNSLC